MKRIKRAAAAVLEASMLLTSPVWAAEQTVPVVEDKSGSTVQLLQKPELTEEQKQTLDKFYSIMPVLKELSVQHVEDFQEGTAWAVSLSDRTQDAAPGIQNVNAHLSFETKTEEGKIYPKRD